ncbi:hypothetical protein [Streptomyces auratus]|uniref:Uncharacterized protein n=1 Tax=Streptomyces auratus AGR0001 TaxID=1160718 RepID=A0A8B1PAL5_9ACTN|nr:hypothetical protein [Streptomyces auratus]QTZ94422.1 hypothetical protein SU9_025690 [Streptomyces auratus AGR0001]
MASNDKDFKPGAVKFDSVPDPAPKGSGAAQEASNELIESRSQFTEPGLDDLKDMVAGANPGEVANVAEGWKSVRKQLVGGGDSWEVSAADCTGGIKKRFDDAVKKVLQSWHGTSAEQFEKAAQRISNNFGKLAEYPHNTGYILHQISERLAEAKKFVDSVEEPDWLDSAGDYVMDSGGSTAKGAAVGTAAGGPGVGTVIGAAVGTFVGGRDDSQLKADLKDPNMTIWDAMNKNRGSLSAGKEAQLQGAHYMEQLATTYRAGVRAIGKPPIGGGGSQNDKIPERDDTGSGPMPPIGTWGPTPTGPKGGAPAPNIPGMKGGGYKTPQPMEPPRPHGIDGGIGSAPKTPNVGTGLDGLSGGKGIGAGGGGAGGGIGGGAGGGVGSGSLGAGSGAGAGSGSGIGGGGMGGMAGGAAGRMGGAGAGAARGGRAGMPGMGGGAAGAGKGAGAKGAGGKGGPLARQKGGAVGKAGKAGAGAQGGSGLHRSRGGTQKGAAGGRRPAGMAGAHGAHGGKDKGKGENGQRPDYLVEEEETWTPERNVAPKVIE